TIEDLELSAPGPGELLVRMEAAGLCHSDLSVVDGNRVRPVPMLLGHEAAGVVEQLGPGDSDLRPGRRVVMTFLPRCGHCPACATDGLTPCAPGSAANTAGTLLSGAIRLTRDGQPVQPHLGISDFASHAVVDRRSEVPVDSAVAQCRGGGPHGATATSGSSGLISAPPNYTQTGRRARIRPRPRTRPWTRP